MEFEVGKVASYDGYCGTVISQNGKYMFLNEDIVEEKNLEEGQLVAFRGEEVQGEKRAYFIRNLEKVLNGKEKQKSLEDRR